MKGLSTTEMLKDAGTSNNMMKYLATRKKRDATHAMKRDTTQSSAPIQIGGLGGVRNTLILLDWKKATVSK